MAPDRPFVLVGQQSLFDPNRAPAGKHTAWTYTHVPAGFEGSVQARVEAQIERFAPGFRDIVTASHVTTPDGLEAYNPNYRGGDIAIGAHTLLRMLGRPGSAQQPLPNRYSGCLPLFCRHSTRSGCTRHVWSQRGRGCHTRAPGRRAKGEENHPVAQVLHPSGSPKPVRDHLPSVRLDTGNPGIQASPA